MTREPSALDTAAVCSPASFLWRVGWREDPLSTRDYGPVTFDDAQSGNRYDSLTGTYSTGYFGTTQEACLGETLDCLRPDPVLSALVEDDYASKGYKPGVIPASWRHERVLVRARIDTRTLAFLNMENTSVVAVIGERLGSLEIYGLTGHLDIGVLRGRDRRITRAVSQHVHDGRERFAGLHYLSRHSNEWECWATFEERVAYPVEDLKFFDIDPDNEALQAVAEMFRLEIEC